MLQILLIPTIFFLPFFCFASHILDQMSIEEKVGQLLMVHFNGQEANEEARVLIQELHIGSIIYYNWANGLDSPTQVKCLSNSLQQLAKDNRLSIPLIIATDQEGGVTSRLTKGFTIFPGNMALGITEEPSLAKKSAFIMGKEMQAVGINMNLAPVVDINSNPYNPIIGIRSFGSSAKKVTAFAKSALQGFKKAKVLTSIKHFPGHGDVNVDSHEGLPILNKNKEELYQLELRPFVKLAPMADTVMTAHIMIPSIDPKNCATLSKSILDILRKEIGFTGVIVSDSLVMEGLLENCNSIDEATIQAFNAGCDILMLGGKQLYGKNHSLELTVEDAKRIHLGLVHAVKTGQITEERLNESVKRILLLKERYPLTTPNLTEFTNILSKESQQLANSIAVKSLKTIKRVPLSVALKKSSIALIAPTCIKEELLKTTLPSIGNTIAFYTYQNITEEEKQHTEAIIKQSDIVIFCSYNAWQYPSQIDFGNSFANKPCIVINLRDPIDASFFPEAALILQTFGPTMPSLQSAADFLSMNNSS